MTIPFNPEHRTEHNEAEGQNSLFDGDKYHGGKLHPEEGGERPEVEFNTPLVEAHDSGAVGSNKSVFDELGVIDPNEEVATPPEGERDTDYFQANRQPHRIEQVTKKPLFQRTSTRVAGGLLALGSLVAGGAIAFGGGEDTPQAAPTEEASTSETVDGKGELNTPETANPETINSPTDSTTEETTQSPDSQEYTVAKSDEVGNIDPGVVIPGEEYISVVRQSGEVIKVPKLRLDGSPNELAASTLALISCYHTTGSDLCLNELSQNPSVRNEIIDWRTRDFLWADGEEVQSVFHDMPNPKTPATFVDYTATHNGNRAIRWAEKAINNNGIHNGALRHESLKGDYPWQGTEAREGNNRQYFESMVFEFDDQGLVAYEVVIA